VSLFNAPPPGPATTPAPTTAPAGPGRPDAVAAYCDDEAIALRAAGDFAVLCPRWQVVADALDGRFDPGDPWTLRSATVAFAGSGLAPGHVVELGIGDLLAVAAVSASSATLRRLGQPSGAGKPPGLPAGNTGVRFVCRTLSPQIESASYEANQFFGIDPRSPGRTPDRLYDRRELEQFVVLMTLQKMFVAEVRDNRGDFAIKLAQVRADLNDLRGRLSVRWGATGNDPAPADNVPFGRYRR